MSRFTLFHVHDPMCSWCWAYAPVLEKLLAALQGPDFEAIDVSHVVGGLAPDSDVPMPAELAEHLQGVWRQIQATVPGTTFNFDFWTRNTPRRSTWPACRAVLAAESLAGLAEAMTRGIQRAYYLDARNPSDSEVLISIAAELGMDRELFAAQLGADATESLLLDHFTTARRIGAAGFPSLFIEGPGLSPTRLPLDYAGTNATLSSIKHHVQLQS